MLGGVPGFCPAKVSVEGVRTTPAAVPVPVNCTSCGEPLTLSVTETFAVSGPVAWGWNTAEIVQLCVGAMGEFATHVSVSEKSPEFGPVMPTLNIARGAEPLFVTVMGCDPVVPPTFSPLNASEVGENRIPGSEGTSVPERVTEAFCVAEVDESTKDRRTCALSNSPPAGGLFSFGANSTLTMQVPPGAIIERHEFVGPKMKSAAFGP